MSIASLGHNNVNAVIADLLKMNNAQRQTFAQNHADDPLMLSAAKFVDNKIKEQAQAYLAQQSGAAPPKVNAQVVASMGQQPQQPQGQPAVQAPPPQPQPQPQPQQAAQALPENSGIAQLPAPNMQGMAGGGIVAFARGDIVKGEDGSDYYEGEGGTLLKAGSAEAAADVAKRMFTPASPETRRDRAMSVASSLGAAQAPAGAEVPKAAVGPSMNPGRPLPPVGTMPTDATRRTDARFPGGAPAPTSVSAPLEQRLAAAGDRPPAMPSSQGTSAAEIEAQYARINNKYNPKDVTDPYAAQNEANRADAASVGERQLSDATAREQGLAALLSKREGRIQEREGRIQSTEDLSTKMAIINAGLAMMQSTGKGLSGIAEGATVGTKQYAEGMKASELARQKIEDAKDAFDELRFNQEGMTAKEKTAAIATITNASIAARNAGVQGIKDQRQLNKTGATNVFNKSVEATLHADRERGANARANAMPGEVRAIQLLGNGSYEAGLIKMRDLQADKSGQVYAKLYIDHVADARKNGEEALPPTEFAKRIRGVMSAMAPQGASVVTTKTPVTTGVLSRPD
jgi:hypothetical protein